jgi:hypothetical protein
MPGNGTYEMGGIDGKDWGVWQAEGAPSAVCEWSIRSVARYRGADILDSRQAGPGEKARVNIQADGDVDSSSGEIGDHRLVFMTHNCGAWRFVS